MVVMRHSNAVMILRFWCRKFVLPVGRSGMTKGWRSALGTEFKPHPWREGVGRYPALRDLQQEQNAWKWMKQFMAVFSGFSIFAWLVTCFVEFECPRWPVDFITELDPDRSSGQTAGASLIAVRQCRQDKIFGATFLETRRMTYWYSKALRNDLYFSSLRCFGDILKRVSSPKCCPCSQWGSKRLRPFDERFEMRYLMIIPFQAREKNE